MLADHGVAFSKWPFPCRIIRTEKRHAGRSRVRGQMRQRAIRRNHEAMDRQQRQRTGQGGGVEKLNPVAQLFRENLPQAPPAIDAGDGDPPTGLEDGLRDLQPLFQRPFMIRAEVRSRTEQDRACHRRDP